MVDRLCFGDDMEVDQRAVDMAENLEVGSRSVRRIETRSFPIYDCSAISLGGYPTLPELLLPKTP